MAEADVDLAAWREAISNRALPTPTTTRWQALRAGVVNLWEFEAVEYWYAGGWAQLMGRNETGKSSLMALTTLIPWLDDTASDKIDTLGRSGKQFAYYVRPSGESDRRPTDASLFHGWLWVEYGRIQDGHARFYTTLLHASARTGSATTRLTWCTSVDSRVRGALKLTDGRAVQTAKDVVAPGFERHSSATAYRQHVATHLLGGSVAQLESIGKLLKVTRQPKLGAQLKVDFVTEQLRGSLPELSRTEVDELAKGWDQLDQLRDDLERAQQATKEIIRFQRDAWRPWASAHLRLRADAVAARQTAFDAVTREERSAEAELRASRQAEAELTEARQQAHTRYTTMRAQAATLRESSAYVEAKQRVANLEQQTRDAEAAKSLMERAQQAAKAAQKRLHAARSKLKDRQDELDKATAQLTRQEDQVRGAASAAGVTCLVPLDPDLLQQSMIERTDAVRRVDALRREAAAANHTATSAEHTAEAMQRAADEAKQNAERTWEQAAAERDRMTAAVESWAPEDVRELIPAWLQVLPDTTEFATQPRLLDVIRRDFYDPRQQRMAAGQAHASGFCAT
ncbi:MAG: hypothetical protein Q4D79_11640 [Propionibacteriaceae bacterium]|nr:hypothetical protein [Propionibacteriaceae bacterium]